MTVLVRSEARMHEALRHYELAPDLARVAVVVGDLAQPLFGLGKEAFAALAARVDAVIHNGCEVNGLFSYALLRGANVDGTVTAIRLAGLAGAHLVYVSSVSALASSKVRGKRVTFCLSSLPLFSCRRVRTGRRRWR